MSRADSKHKPSRQIFKDIHHQDTKAAEIRNFLPNFAVPEAWEGKEREVQEEKFSCWSCRNSTGFPPQLLPSQWHSQAAAPLPQGGGSFMCAHLGELVGLLRAGSPCHTALCAVVPCRGMGRWGLSMPRMPWPDFAAQDPFAAEELHGMG